MTSGVRPHAKRKLAAELEGLGHVSSEGASGFLSHRMPLKELAG